MERSGRSNDYLRQPGGVLVANWFEERCAASGPAPDAPPALQPAAWLTSTQEQQRAAAAMRPTPAEPPASRFTPGALKTSLTAHGDPGEAPVSYWATLNSLAYGDKFVGMPRVQAFLFTGKNLADAKVPVSTTSLAATSTMRAAWMRDAAADPWTTTSASAAQAAALAAAAGRLKAARPGY